jgi:hypothetical protein
MMIHHSQLYDSNIGDSPFLFGRQCLARLMRQRAFAVQVPRLVENCWRKRPTNGCVALGELFA